MRGHFHLLSRRRVPRLNENRLRLHGFNNLTKALSFNIYDICYAKTEAVLQALFYGPTDTQVLVLDLMKALTLF
jgi:hypothetical protein